MRDDFKIVSLNLEYTTGSWGDISLNTFQALPVNLAIRCGLSCHQEFHGFHTASQKRWSVVRYHLSPCMQNIVGPSCGSLSWWESLGLWVLVLFFHQVQLMLRFLLLFFTLWLSAAWHCCAVLPPFASVPGPAEVPLLPSGVLPLSLSSAIALDLLVLFPFFCYLLPIQL